MSDLFKALIGGLGATLNALTPRTTIPLALAAWVLLYAHAQSLFKLSEALVTSSFVSAVVFSCFAVTGTAAILWDASQTARESCSRWIWERRERKRIETELAYLTEKERDILAYLLAKKQRVIEALPDGEHAATLITKGFLALPLRRPPGVHRDVVFAVPDHVWRLLILHQERFHYQQPKTDIHPWRMHWMSR